VSNIRDIKVLAILGYEAFYGGERANLKVIKMIRDGGVAVECVVVKNGGKLLKEALTEGSFVYHPARFGPSFFGLSGNPVHYMKNLIGMILVAYKVIQVSRTFRPTHLYVPNYIQFLYVWFSLAWIKADVVFRIGDPPENNGLHRFLWKRIIEPKVQRFVANSKYTLDRLNRNNIDKRKGIVINNCLTYDVSRKIKIKDKNERAIVYIGQIRKQKGVDIAVLSALKICKEYCDVKFHFWGSIDLDIDFSKRLIQLIETNDLADRILFCGYSMDVMAELQSAYLHICPSVQEESSANVVIEAKHAGIPSVVFPRGGFPELIEHRRNGYICEQADAESLFAGIAYYLENADLYKDACVAAKESCSKYSEKNIQKKWMEVFKHNSVYKNNSLCNRTV